MSLDSDTSEATDQDKLRWSADIVASYVAQNSVTPAQIPELIRSVYEALNTLGQAPAPARPTEKQKPAISDLQVGA